MSDVCTICGLEIQVGDYPCITFARPHQRGINGAIGDECDIVQENGFRHPTRFRSKRELTRALAERGLEQRVRHVTIPGTDKSPFTTDWSKGSLDAQTLKNAEVLVARMGHGSKDTTSPEPNAWTAQPFGPQDVA